MSDHIKLLEKKLAREIKAREQAEQLLEEKTEELFDTLLSISQSKALLQTALSSIQEGFLLTDSKGNILLTNHQLKTMYEQWAPSMHKDMNINDFFAPFTDHPAYQNMLKEGLKASSFEIKFSENQVIAVNVSNNDDEFIASTHSDITKEK